MTLFYEQRIIFLSKSSDGNRANDTRNDDNDFEKSPPAPTTTTTKADCTKVATSIRPNYEFKIILEKMNVEAELKARGLSLAELPKTWLSDSDARPNGAKAVEPQSKRRKVCEEELLPAEKEGSNAKVTVENCAMRILA